MKVLAALVGISIVAFVLSLPLAFFVMLSAGILGHPLSFWACVPIAFVIKAFGGNDTRSN